MSFKLAFLTLTAALLQTATPQRTTPASPSTLQVNVANIRFPRAYRDTLRLYALSDRPDGVIRKLYISPEALTAVRAGRDVPVGTVSAIEAYLAARDSQGWLRRDADAHLVKGDLDQQLHVMVKQAGGRWAFRAFDARSGAVVTRDLAECQTCHVRAARDSIFTYGALLNFVRTGERQRVDCDRADREPC